MVVWTTLTGWVFALALLCCAPGQGADMTSTTTTPTQGRPAPTTLAPAAPSTPTWPRPVEAWRPEVQVWFNGDDVNRVLDLIQCESYGDPWAENPTETRYGHGRGLLQHMSELWGGRSGAANAAGYPNSGDIWNPNDQLAVAKYLIDKTPQSWGHWDCYK